MKKYFIAVAVLALWTACNGKAAKDAPVLVEEESQTLVPEKEEVVQEKYKGTVPAADGPGIVYELTLFQQPNGEEDIYEMKATYLEADNGKDWTFTSTGKRQVRKGTPADAEAIVYELVPDDGNVVFYFLAEGDSLTMLNQELQQAASDLNYTLKRTE